MVPRYDVDDSASKPQQPVKVEAPEPTPPVTKPQIDHDSHRIEPEPLPESKQDDQNDGHYFNAPDGDSAMNWGNGHTDGPQNNHYGDGPSESHGIGIKEDG